jgi:hypothetical protein
MLSELHSLNLKLCSKQYNKAFVLHLIVAPQLRSGWQHNYSTKTKQAGQVNKQSMCSLMSMSRCHLGMLMVNKLRHSHINVMKLENYWPRGGGCLNSNH